MHALLAYACATAGNSRPEVLEAFFTKTVWGDDPELRNLFLKFWWNLRCLYFAFSRARSLLSKRATRRARDSLLIDGYFLHGNRRMVKENRNTFFAPSQTSGP